MPPLRAFPEHSISFQLHHIPAGQILGHLLPFIRTLDPVWGWTCPTSRGSESSSWLELQLAGLPLLAPLPGLALACTSALWPCTSPGCLPHRRRRGRPAGKLPDGQLSVISPVAPTEATKRLPSPCLLQLVGSSSGRSSLPACLPWGKSKS